MKPSVNNVKSNQPKMLSKREEKKQIDRKLPSGLFFQIGLIISLLAVIFLMETTIGYSSNLPGPAPDKQFDPPTIDYTVEETPVIKKPVALVKVPKPEVPVPIIRDKVNVVSNTTLIVDDAPVDVMDNRPTIDTPVVATPVKPIDPNRTENVNSVEFVPVFPGCESLSNNEERKACMSSKISAFISKRFNSDDFNNLKKDDIHKIWVQFKIDTQGNVTDVVARAAQKDMREEGVRVLSKLPQMTPGKMGNTNVNVSYMVPISFKVQ
ncbi:MAG: energy transducer TonB [Patiriisocius sp.]|uniref:energy transducer TonB n=1 Tax=Patiriisocius sp. TaxID=2822396 RepID=UPI003EFB0DB0